MSILVRSIGITLAVIVVLAVVVIAVYMVRRSREKARGLRVKKSSATQNSITVSYTHLTLPTTERV